MVVLWCRIAGAIASTRRTCCAGKKTWKGERDAKLTEKKREEMAQGARRSLFGRGKGRVRHAEAEKAADEAMQQRIDFLASTVQRKTRERHEILGDVEVELYEAEHDAAVEDVRGLPKEFEAEDVERRIATRMEQIGAVNEELTTNITESYKSFVEGMSKVAEMQQELEKAFKYAKEARKHLEDADAEVRHGIAIARDTRRKQRLQQVLQLMLKLKTLHADMEKLQVLAPQEEFQECFRVCMSLHNQMIELKDLLCITELQAKLDQALHDIIVRIDELLSGVCESFSPERYLPILQAYVELDDVDVLAEKVQTAFSEIILGKTSGIARTMVLSMPEEEFSTLKRQKILSGVVPFNDLVSHLSSEHFRPCLSKVMESLYDTYSSCFKMMQWHRNHLMDLEGNCGTSSPSDRGKNQELLISRKVEETLDNSRTTLWNLGCRRVTALLALPTGTEGEHFLQILEWMRMFTSLGESFAGKGATAQLQSAFERQSARYFAAFHKQNLEMVNGMLEKEVWQALPIGSTSLPDLCQAYKVGGTLVDDGINVGGSEEWLMGGNPWKEDGSRWGVEVSSPCRLPPSPVCDGTNETAGGTNSKSQNGGKSSSANDPEGKPPSAPGGHPLEKDGAVSRHAGDQPNWVMTSTSLKVLRLMEEYLGAVGKLSPDANVFGGICQLFECCMLYTFQAFGLVTDESSENASSEQLGLNGLTPRLRKTIIAISQSIENAGTLRKPADFLAMRSQGESGQARNSMSGRGGTMSQGNLFGLKERSVATESLVVMAEEIKRIKGLVLADSRLATSSATEQFFNRTLEATGDLREHVYRTASRLLLNVERLPERIGSTKYDIREIGVQHNAWVTSLIAEFKSLSARLSVAGIGEKVSKMLLGFAVEVCAHHIVEGLSRVKKCSQEGRGMMALDMQVLINSLEDILEDVPVSPSLMPVDNYIKGFYVAEENLLEWIQVHPEFTKTQVLSLIQCISNKYTIVSEEGRRKRKFLKELSSRLA